jgi:CheY-like chemotaxis protein
MARPAASSLACAAWNAPSASSAQRSVSAAAASRAARFAFNEPASEAAACASRSSIVWINRVQPLCGSIPFQPSSVPAEKRARVRGLVPSPLSTADMLTDLGDSVADAANGKKALELLDKDVFDVIVTDFAMPDVSGDEIASRAINQHSGLRIIFATGYEALLSRVGVNGLKGAVMLQKPYDQQRTAVALVTAIS